MINSGFVTGLSLASLAGVALLHLETDHGQVGSEWTGATECRSLGQQMLFNCEVEGGRSLEMEPAQSVLVGSTIGHELEVGDVNFDWTRPQGHRLPAAVSASGSK